MTEFLVKTQLIPPKLKKDILRRNRLLKVLHHNQDKKLILVTGGAGYGKTTLLAQFVEELKSPFVFYAISKLDSSLNTFISYLITGIRETYKHFGSRTHSLISHDRVELEMLMGTFVNELLEIVDKDLVIIIDDYHLLDKIEIINGALDYLLEHMPSNIHLIISSRTEPSLSIAKIRAKGESTKLGRDELKFTSEEMRLLFREAYKLAIPDSLITEVGRYSEGWITGLQIISYLIEKSPEDVLNKLKYGRENFDYFASEVFEQQLDEVRYFLLRSSILEQMTPVSCDVVLDRNDSYDVLSGLVKKNLFISHLSFSEFHSELLTGIPQKAVGKQEEVFSYHPLFRDFLLKRLSQELGEAVNSLHLRAANYFKSMRDYSNSIAHYLSAGDMDSALKLIEKEGENLVEALKFDTLEQWIRELSDNLVKKNATLLWYQGEIFRWQGKWDEAIENYKKAKKKFIKEGKLQESAKTMCGMASTLRFRGDYAKAMRLGEKVLSIIGKKEVLLKAKVLNEIAAANYHLIRYHKAASLYSEGLRVCRNIGNHKFETLLMTNLSACHMYLGEHDRSIEINQRLIKKQSSVSEYPFGWIYADLGYAYATKGDFSKGMDALQSALKIHNTFNDKRGINEVFLKLGYLNLMMGNYKESRAYSEKALSISMGEKGANQRALNNIGMSYLLEDKFVKASKYINKEYYLSLTNAQIRLEFGDLEEAEKILNSALKWFHKSQAKVELMLTHSALAKLYYKKGEREMLIKHLGRALVLSMKYNYHFLLLRLGRMDFFLLQFAIENGIESKYASFLLNEIEKQYDLTVNMFGGLRIKGVEEKRWKRQKPKSLFCYFLVNKNKKLLREKLMELLWPAKNPSKGQVSLRQALFHIRNAIEPIVKQFSERVTINDELLKILAKDDKDFAQLMNKSQEEVSFIIYGNEYYWVNPVYKIWIDCEEFERLIKEARGWEARGKEKLAISAYKSAISLYKGDFLPETYDLWSDDQRLFYKEEYLKALDKLVNFYINNKKFNKAIEYCKKIISVDEFRESAYIIAMRSYMAMGAHKSAIDLYNKLKKVFQCELGIEPPSEAQKLFHHLTNH